MSGAEQSKAFYNMLKEADTLAQDSLICELEKPDSEIDARFVRELLSCEPVAASSAQESKALLDKLNAKLRREKREGRTFHDFGKALRVAAIVAAAVVVFIISTCSAAYALNWTFLIRIFEPVMETFGITWNTDGEGPDARDQAVQDNKTADLEDDFGFVNETYTDITDVPTEINGYVTMPRQLPAGYEFSYANYRKNFAKTSLDVVYTNGNTEIACRFYVMDNDNWTSASVSEQDTGTGSIVTINDVDVVLSYNEGIVCASWNHDNIYYSIWGLTDEDTILDLAKQFLE